MKNERDGNGSSVPPERVWVMIYFSQKGRPDDDAGNFYNHFRQSNWQTKRGKPLANWKTAAWHWIFDA